MIKLNQCLIKGLKEGDYKEGYGFEDIKWHRWFDRFRLDDLINEINEYIDRQIPNQVINISIGQREGGYLLSITMRAGEWKDRVVKNEETLDNVKRIMKQDKSYQLGCTNNIVSLIYIHRKLIYEESLKSLAI